MRLKQILHKNKEGVSQILGVVIAITIILSIGVTISHFTIEMTAQKGSFSSNLFEDLQEQLGGDEHTIVGTLGCPCDMLITNSGNEEKIGYTTAGPDRSLCEEMEEATLLSDDGVEERYSIEVRSNEVNNLIYQITCFDNGKYTFTVEYITSEETRSVVANGIDVNEYAVHKYQIDWGSRPPTVTLWIDEGGDGDFEKEITKETDTITNEIIGDPAVTFSDPPYGPQSGTLGSTVAFTWTTNIETDGAVYIWCDANPETYNHWEYEAGTGTSHAVNWVSPSGWPAGTYYYYVQSDDTQSEQCTIILSGGGGRPPPASPIE